MFKPKLLEAFQGYNRERLVQDVGAGITVGVVALPLAMAFAIASGLKPEAGLFTAIIAGFLMTPVLTVISDWVGITGGWVVARFQLQ